MHGNMVHIIADGLRKKKQLLLKHGCTDEFLRYVSRVSNDVVLRRIGAREPTLMKTKICHHYMVPRTLLEGKIIVR